MLLTEYRVILPVSVEEYQVAQLYSVAEASKNETGGGEGIEVRKNEPFSQFENCPKEPLFADNRIFIDGQYTHKIYYLQRKVPALIRVFAPSKSLEIHEEAWNAYPYCRTIITNPDYMKKDFILKIESMHLPDRGTTENAHNLSEEQLRHRKVCIIDIASDLLSSKDYKANEDPRKYRSEKTGRGPLEGNWIETVCPVMCAYKLVSVEFRWFGLQARIEELIMKQEKRLFTNFHRQVFCWTDKWHGLEMKDIRQLEDKTKDDLDQQLCDGQIRGTYTD